MTKNEPEMTENGFSMKAGFSKMKLLRSLFLYGTNSYCSLRSQLTLLASLAD